MTWSGKQSMLSLVLIDLLERDRPMSRRTARLNLRLTLEGERTL